MWLFFFCIIAKKSYWCYYPFVILKFYKGDFAMKFKKLSRLVLAAVLAISTMNYGVVNTAAEEKEQLPFDKEAVEAAIESGELDGLSIQVEPIDDANIDARDYAGTHNTMELVPEFANSTWPYAATVEIGFKMTCYGDYYGESYYVVVADKDGNLLVGNENVFRYDPQYYMLYLSWDQKVGGELVDPGMYYVYYWTDYAEAADLVPFYLEEPITGKFASYQGYDFFGYEDGSVRCFDKSGNAVINDFKCDGTYTYYFQADGTAMKERLTYHPNGVEVIYFDSYGHEVFSNFDIVRKTIEGNPVRDLCFFNVYGYLYVDVLTYDQAGVNLYYANPYGVMECSGWFEFSPKQGGGYGYANTDGTLMCNQYTYDWNGNLVYMEGDGSMRGSR